MVLRVLSRVRMVGSYYELAGAREVWGLCAAVTDVFTCFGMGMDVEAGYSLVSGCTFDFEGSSMHRLPIPGRWQWTSRPVSLSTIDSNPRVWGRTVFQVMLSSFCTYENGNGVVLPRGLRYTLRPVFSAGCTPGDLVFDHLDVYAVSIRDPSVKLFMRW